LAACSAIIWAMVTALLTCIILATRLEEHRERQIGW
jgi:hypothetical protein